MPRPRKPSAAVRFQTGAKVRVKSDIRVPDFSADIDRHKAALGERPRRSGPHGPRADTRRPAPRCQTENPAGLLRYLAANLKFPFKARTESDGTSLTVSRLIDPKEYELRRRGRAALRSS